MNRDKIDISPEDKEPKILIGETYSKKGITLSVVFDTRRLKANGYYNVKCRVTYKRKQVYYNAGVDLLKEEWYAMPSTRKKNLQDQRDLIQREFNNIKAHIEDLIRGEGFSFEKLNARLSRGMRNSVLSSMFDKAKHLKESGRVGTSDWYYYSAKSIQEFTGNKDIKFNSITKEWLQKYQDHLLEAEKSRTTISIYMRALQAIINDAKEESIITQSQYPFGKGKFQIQNWTSRKMALSLSQIGEILKYPLVTESDRKCRDLWFFMYLCNGININDLLRLKYSNIKDDEIRYYRKKTARTKSDQKEIAATILPQMKKIIIKWGNPESKPKNFIFPYLYEDIKPIDEQRIVKNLTKLINDKMTIIGKDLGYGNISTYTARHSYATVLKRSGANIGFISESLGHADLKTTENYLASFEKEERQKNAQLLTKFE